MTKLIFAAFGSQITSTPPLTPRHQIAFETDTTLPESTTVLTHQYNIETDIILFSGRAEGVCIDPSEVSAVLT